MDIYVKCDRCGEVVKTHIIKGNELAATYSEEGPAYTLRKELIGSLCPNRVKLYMEFDVAKRITAKRKPPPLEVVYNIPKKINSKAMPLKAFWLGKSHLLCRWLFPARILAEVRSRR